MDNTRVPANLRDLLGRLESTPGITGSFGKLVMYPRQLPEPVVPDWRATTPALEGDAGARGEVGPNPAARDQASGARKMAGRQHQALATSSSRDLHGDGTLVRDGEDSHPALVNDSP